MDKNNLSSAALLSLSMVFGNVSRLEAQIPVEISGVPSTADSVFVLADGDELSSPLEAFARLLEKTPLVRLSLPPAKSQSLRIRAVTFAGASVFPTVTAIGTTTFATGQGVPARLILAWPKPVIEKLPDRADGSTSILVTFTGTDFFRSGDVLELWISGSSWSRNCTGTHFLAPLIKTDVRWQAQFLIPTSLCAGTAMQVAYHALAFKVFPQIPLFVWPNRERNESPLQIVLTTLDPPANRFSAAEYVSDDRTGQKDPTSIDHYIVALGKDGRLHRILIKTPVSKPDQ
jgi:hypothetical protein